MDIITLTKGHPFASHMLAPVLCAKDKLQGGPMHRAQGKALDRFLSPEQREDRRLIRWIKRDMWYSYLCYRCTFNEYFLFGFYRLSHTSRRQFVTEEEKAAFTLRLVDANPNREIFRDKFKEYQTFQAYYRRDVIRADGELSYDAFLAFIQRHPRFLAKPYSASCGEGIRFVDSVSAPPQELFEQFRKQSLVLEEPIVQCQALAKFHPSSVNTIRITTFVKDGAAHILFTFLKLGRAGSIVDNGGAGGILVPLDTATGVAVGPGITEDLSSFLLHPDTGEQIIGFCVPRWEEAKRLALELAMITPEQPYVGWDLALTDDGWVMVEGNNAGQFIGPQVTARRGIRPLLRQYFDL